MKIGIHRVRALPLISLLSLFAFAVQADAQGYIVNQLRGSPKVRGKTGKTCEARPKLADVSAYSVLYSFCSESNCVDGTYPYAGLIQDAVGNLYGTTQGGGANSGANGAYGGGAVFKLDSTGQEIVLYSFCSESNCTDGSEPSAGLIQDAAGNLYGTTLSGGANLAGGPNEGGTVFKLDTSGHETVLYSFCSVTACTDGDAPYAGLITDAAGNLYGTTFQGGANGAGTVFKVDTTGHETVLHSFCSPGPLGDCTDGEQPEAGLIQDAAGNLYGTTTNGGANINYGTVFKVDTAGHETVLYSFCSAPGCTDGATPYAGLIQDAAGNLYGTTFQGGANHYGTVFKLDTAGHETVLYSFCSIPGCTDGQYSAVSLVQDAAGNLYGTTPYGGANTGANGDQGGGTLFKVDSTGQETVLYSFCSASDCTDGLQPQAGLIQDAAGNLYGTTVNGGANGYGYGTVFKLAALPTPTVTVEPSSSSITTLQVLNVTVAVNGGSGNPTSTGTVTLSSGNYTSAAATLSGGGATINVPAGSLTAGMDILRASYSGDSKYSAATGTNSVAVTLLTPTVTVTPSSSNITAAQALNVTVAVNDGSGNPTPTGTVTLTSGSYTSTATTLSGGSATINIPAGSLAVGTDTLTGTYSGDSNYSTATGTSSVTVTATPSFTLGGNAVSVSPGATIGNASTITVTPGGGFTGSVALTAAVTSSPAGVQDLPTLSFGSTSPVSITSAAAGMATLTISTTAATSSSLAFPARPGIRWHTTGGTTLAFVLFFGIGIPARGRSWRTRLGLLVFLVILTGGFIACGSEGGGGGNPGTSPGTYIVTVTGTSGSTTATSTVTLTVR